MDRREILKYTTYLTGAAIAAPLASSILSGCKTEPSDVVNKAVSFFSEDDMGLLQQIIDVIIPRTDSPSASDVGVHQTIEHMVSTVYPKEDKEAYRKAMSDLFVNLRSGVDINDMVASIEDSSTETAKDVKDAYNQLKNQTIAYYLTTEEVGTKFLNYLPVPGEYKGCISLEEAGGKKWAI